MVLYNRVCSHFFISTRIIIYTVIHPIGFPR
jgi:hypothetical protein